MKQGGDTTCERERIEMEKGLLERDLGLLAHLKSKSADVSRVQEWYCLWNFPMCAG